MSPLDLNPFPFPFILGTPVEHGQTNHCQNYLGMTTLSVKGGSPERLS